MEDIDKYHQAVIDSRVTENDNEVATAVKEIIEKHAAENNTPDNLKFLFSCIDLTTLNSTDSPRSVADFTERVNAFENEYPEIPSVAAICVYPNMVAVVRTVLDVSSVEIAAVSGGFPSSQTFPEVKVAETALAIDAGADEIDIVLNLGDFLDGDYQEVADQISELKEVCRDNKLKVILETGALQSAERIKAASVLALYSGADFLKTSTGKGYPGASLEAAYVMAQCIKEYYEKTGRKVGFKCSGGVRTAADAVAYYTIIREVLGEEWLTNDLFRIGASGLANNLLADILNEPGIKFF